MEASERVEEVMEELDRTDDSRGPQFISWLRKVERKKSFSVTIEFGSEVISHKTGEQIIFVCSMKPEGKENVVDNGFSKTLRSQNPFYFA